MTEQETQEQIAKVRSCDAILRNASDAEIRRLLERRTAQLTESGGAVLNFYPWLYGDEWTGTNRIVVQTYPGVRGCVSQDLAHLIAGFARASNAEKITVLQAAKVSCVMFGGLYPAVLTEREYLEHMLLNYQQLWDFLSDLVFRGAFAKIEGWLPQGHCLMERSSVEFPSHYEYKKVPLTDPMLKDAERIGEAIIEHRENAKE